MAQVTGLGGAFLKAKDPKALYAWYEHHLGLSRDPNAGVFSFPSSAVTGDTLIAFFPDDSAYFGAGAQRSMLNLRVNDLDALLEALTAAGVQVDPDRQAYDFGKFGWITDPEGNRVELWQPLDHSHSDSGV